MAGRVSSIAEGENCLFFSAPVWVCGFFSFLAPTLPRTTVIAALFALVRSFLGFLLPSSFFYYIPLLGLPGGITCTPAGECRFLPST